MTLVVLDVFQSIQDFINSQSWQFWGVVVALITLVLAYLGIQQGPLRKRMVYRVLLDTPITIFPEIVKGMVDLQHRSTQKLLQGPLSLVLLRIENMGRAEVKPQEFTFPLSFSFRGRTVVASEVPETKPPILKKLIDQTPPPPLPSGIDPDEVVVLPTVNLNPKTQVKVVALLSGVQDPTRGKKAVECLGIISNGRVIKEDSRRSVTVASGLLATALILVGVLVALVFLKPSSQPSGMTCIAGALKISGSSALFSLANPVAGNYQRLCPGATVNVISSDSSQGLVDVQAGRVDIGNSDVSAPTTPAYAGLVSHPVAVVLYEFIIHREHLEGITDLSTPQLRMILGGNVTNWAQLGGPDLPITIVGRTTSSGTRQTLSKYLLKEEYTLPLTLLDADCQTVVNQPAFARGIRYCEASGAGDVVKRVDAIDGAIGYTDLAKVAGDNGVKPINIDHFPAQRNTALSNQYTFWSTEQMYTKGNPSAESLATAFLNYMTGDYANKIATENQYILYNDAAKAVVPHL